MKNRLVLAALFILAVPLLFSHSQKNSFESAAPFATVALAGHTIVGQWCDCGQPGCICDPGEDPGIESTKPATDSPKASHQGRTPVSAQSRSGFDFGTGTLFFALALLLWARLRA